MTSPTTSGPRTRAAVWVLVPGTPVLLPGVAGASDPAADLRATCVEALAAALADGTGPVTVLAAGTATRTWPADGAYDLARLVGGNRPPTGSSPQSARPSIPLPLAVGRHLLRAAGWTGPTVLQTIAYATADAATDATTDATADPPTGRVIAVGDGSLYRHEKGGPGPLDPRAAAYDDQVRRALATGDAPALRDLDPALGAELGVTGRLPWRLLARAVGTTPVDARLDFAGDPFGPYAVVATWRFG